MYTAKKINRYGNIVIKPISPELISFLQIIGKKELTTELIRALAQLNIKITII